MIHGVSALNEKRRAQLRAELSARYAHLYGLTRDELRYTPLGVDPICAGISIRLNLKYLFEFVLRVADG